MNNFELCKTCTIKAIKKSLDFKTRTPKKEFWGFAIPFLIAQVTISITNLILCLLLPPAIALLLNALVGLALLASCLPLVAATARRFQDTGKPGLFALFWLIPIVGLIMAIIWGTQPSQNGDNKWGPQPTDIA